MATMTIEEKVRMVQEIVEYDPVVFADKNYGIEYGDLFRGVLSQGIWETVRTCKHNKDKSRSWIRYCQDIVIGWVIEDYLFQLLTKLGYKVWMNGVDKERRFSQGKDITGATDFIIEMWGTRYQCEMISDWSGYWGNEGHGHLRDNKLPNLIQLSVDSFVMLLCVDIRNQRYGFLEIEPTTPSRKHTVKAWGDKVVHDTDIPKSIFRKFPNNKSTLIRV